MTAALGATPAAAQQAGTIARLSNLEGNVMVSQGDGMVAAVKDQRVPAGTRVLTMSGGKVTINYDVGCAIRLSENQRFTVRAGECGILLSEVATIVPTAAVATGVAAASFASAAPLMAIGVGLGVGTYETFRNNSSDSVSPN
ncbi:MAG: hypothetical protein HS109_20685 [Burkholderiales bacterium]|nr:hypothetical protein [Burkholderiales bacterium]